MNPVEINAWAVLVSAIATFVLGGLWYSPILFGKLWMKTRGHSESQLEAMKQSVNRAYLVSFLCYIFMAVAFSALVSFTGVSTPIQGIGLGILIWVGFAATIGLTGNMFSQDKISAYLIDSGYQLAYLILMGLILTLWAPGVAEIQSQ